MRARRRRRRSTSSSVPFVLTLRKIVGYLGMAVVVTVFSMLFATAVLYLVTLFVIFRPAL